MTDLHTEMKKKVEELNAQMRAAEATNRSPAMQGVLKAAVAAELVRGGIC